MRLCIIRSEEHTSELQSHSHLVCRLLLEKKKTENSLELETTVSPLSFSDPGSACLSSKPGELSRHLCIPSFRVSTLRFFFFFNDTATTEIYTLSLHDALPIYSSHTLISYAVFCLRDESVTGVDRKSTRLNSSHTLISYAVFCFQKKTTKQQAQSQMMWRLML